MRTLLDMFLAATLDATRKAEIPRIILIPLNAIIAEDNAIASGTNCNLP